MRATPTYTICLVLASCLVTSTCGASEPRNPYPANAAIDVPVDVVLEWISVPGADWDDVFFGTNRYSVNLAREGSAEHKGVLALSTYDPGGLEPGTTYYWKIVASQRFGEFVLRYEGPVWSFTTGPARASNPSPADGATCVPPDVVLSWTPGCQAIWHDVYLGASFDDVNGANTSSPEYKDRHDANRLDPGALAPATTYWWRVVEWVQSAGGDMVAVPGHVWRFTTASLDEESRAVAGALSIKVNLYDGLRVDPNGVGKDPNAVDPNAVIELVNRNFRDNGFNYRLVITDVNTVDPNDGGPNHHGGDNGHGTATAGDGRIQHTERRQYNPSDPNDPNNGRYLGDDPDSELSDAFRYGRDEAVRQRTSGQQDPNLQDPNNWDRIKISIVKAFVDETRWFDPNGNYIDSTYATDNPGYGAHRWPTVLAAVKGIRDAIVDHSNRPAGSDSYRAGDANDANVFNERMAETIKHEIGHMLTLSGGHQIGPDLNDPNDRANDSGHAPETPRDPNDPDAQANDPNGSGNFMAPSTWRHGSMMTEAQKDEMAKMARKLARTVSQNEPNKPAQKVRQQAGTTSDRSKDLSEPGLSWPSIYDLGLIYLHGLHWTDTSGGDICNIDAIIGADAVLPEDQRIEVQYTLGFDIDANTETGITHGNRQGVDRIVHVMAEGTISDGSFGLIATVLNTISQTTQVLPEIPSYEIEDRFPDIGVEAMPIASSFLFKIPKSMLDFSAHCIPVVVTSGPDGDTTYDTADLFFDRLLWMEYPTMELFGDGVPVPGEDYPFVISGLEPHSPYQLRLEGRVVHTGVLDPYGSATGSFVFPHDVPVTTPSFLVAQDSTGKFAFNVTSVCSTCQCQVEVDKRVWDETKAEYYWVYCGGPGSAEYTFVWEKKDVESVDEHTDDLGRPCIVVTFKEGPPYEKRYRCTNNRNCRSEIEITEDDTSWKGSIECHSHK